MRQPIPLVIASLLAACEAAPEESVAAPLTNTPPETWRTDIDLAEAMAEIEAEATVGAEHDRLAEFLGTWDVLVKARGGPSEEWRPSKGTATFTSVLDGRFVVEETETVLGGKPFKRYHVHGYDNLAECYFTVSFGSLSTWPTYSTGQFDEDTSEWHFHGQMKGPVTPGGRPFKTVTRAVDGDNMVTELYDSIDGEMVMIGEFKYARRPQ